MKLIDKDAIVAEILNRVKKIAAFDVGDSKVLEAIYDAKCHALNSTLSFLDTLEVKEVDLEKEIRHTCRGYRITDSYDGLISKKDIENIAHHFYKLGLNARKEE